MICVYRTLSPPLLLQEELAANEDPLHDREMQPMQTIAVASQPQMADLDAVSHQPFGKRHLFAGPFPRQSQCSGVPFLTLRPQGQGILQPSITIFFGADDSFSPVSSPTRLKSDELHELHTPDDTTLQGNSSSNTYTSDKNTDDPKELKRQIRFKQQVVKTLTESFNTEVENLQVQIADMQKKLDAKRHPPESMPTAQTKAEFRKEVEDRTILHKPLQHLSLHDEYLKAILTCRQAKVNRGERETLQEQEEEENVDWWRSRERVDLKALIASKYACIFGLFGTGCSIVQVRNAQMSCARDLLKLQWWDRPLTGCVKDVSSIFKIVHNPSQPCSEREIRSNFSAQ